MDGHRTAELRSLAFHRAIAERVRADPSILAMVRARVARWCSSGEVKPAYAEAWRNVLVLPLPELLERLVLDTEQMIALRQVTPFAGVLDPRTRWAIWRSVA